MRGTLRTTEGRRKRRRRRRAKRGVCACSDAHVLVVSIAVTVVATVAGLTNAESALRHSIIGNANFASQPRPLGAHALGSGDAVTAWNANAGEALVAACFIGG